MWSIVLPLLKNKVVWFVIVVVGILTYYNVVVWNLNKTIAKQEIKITKLEQNYHICSTNFDETVEANKETQISINKCLSDVELVSGSYEDIVSSKDKIITDLRRRMTEYKKPVIYPKEVVFKECKIKIKGKADVETNSVLGGLNSIGK